MNRFSVAVSTGFSVALLVFAHPAVAITFPVNDATQDLVDDNPGDGICHTIASTCTLRAAFMEANHSSGAGATITIPAGIYRLTRSATITGCVNDDETCGDLNLTTGSPVITITGAGAVTTIIDANQIDRVLNIDGGRSVIISGVTMRNGYRTCCYGGGIRNYGTLNLSNSTLQDNEIHFSGGSTGIFGGGLYNSGTVTISACTFLGNTSESYGGGIFNNGTLNLVNGTIINNVAYIGSGFSNYTGTATISAATINGNTAVEGGGIYNNDPANLNVSASTINGNAATGGNGGGIYTGGTVFVTNSTIAGNSATGNGGGIYQYNGPANIYNSTIAYNDANSDADSTGYGGGVYIGNSVTLNLRNSLAVGNYVRGDPQFNSDCYGSGTLVPYGRDLTTTLGVCNVATSSSWALLNSLALLGPLQNNGGPTQTIGLRSGSNAIDNGAPAFGCTDQNGNIIQNDQRGYARTVGSACDIGAYEFDPNRIFTNGFE